MKKVLIGGVLIALVGVVVMWSMNSGSRNLGTGEAFVGPDTLTTVPVMEPLHTLYGIDIHRKRVTEGRVRPNQFLATLLEENGLPYEFIRTAVSRSEGVFDVRKFASNRQYAFIHPEDSTQPAEQFVYEPSPYEFIVFNFTDSIFVSRVQRQIDTVEVITSGVIYSSLYETLQDAEALPQLANALADVFAWQVDFFHLAKGDRFKLIYEEYQIEGEPVGVGQIKGAVFEHQNSPYYAVHFDQGGGDDYFDEEGESLRKQFLRAPLDYTRISSRYTMRRFHPVQRRYKAHLGTDYAAPKGTPIRSVGDGVVVEAQYSRYNGNYVKVRHNSVYTTQYLHMSKIAGGLRAGQRVRQGQVIGYVGSTGLATGNHLCYRFWKNGQQVDALRVELPPSEPIKEEYAQAYFVARDAMLDRLNKIAFPAEEMDEEIELAEATEDADLTDQPISDASPIVPTDDAP